MASMSDDKKMTTNLPIKVLISQIYLHDTAMPKLLNLCNKCSMHLFLQLCADLKWSCNPQIQNHWSSRLTSRWFGPLSPVWTPTKPEEAEKTFVNPQPILARMPHKAAVPRVINPSWTYTKTSSPSSSNYSRLSQPPTTKRFSSEAIRTRW